MLPIRFARRTVFTIGIAVWLVGSLPASAGEVNLSWDPSVGASGYRVYSGSSSGNYGTPTDVGSATAEPMAGISDCASTYFAVRAYNSAGDSGFSQEISSWPRPVLNTINDPDGQRGETLNLVIDGVNFEPGSTVQFSVAGIVVNSVTVNSCNQLSTNITVQNTAPFGPAEIIVANTSGVVGNAGALFAVVGASLPNVQNLHRTDTQ